MEAVIPVLTIVGGLVVILLAAGTYINWLHKEPPDNEYPDLIDWKNLAEQFEGIDIGELMDLLESTDAKNAQLLEIYAAEGTLPKLVAITEQVNGLGKNVSDLEGYYILLEKWVQAIDDEVDTMSDSDFDDEDDDADSELDWDDFTDVDDDLDDEDDCEDCLKAGECLRPPCVAADVTKANRGMEPLGTVEGDDTFAKWPKSMVQGHCILPAEAVTDPAEFGGCTLGDCPVVGYIRPDPAPIQQYLPETEGFAYMPSFWMEPPDEFVANIVQFQVGPEAIVKEDFNFNPNLKSITKVHVEGAD